jgi:adenosylhomocysteine nucleosidase
MAAASPIGLVVAMDAELVHLLRAFPPARTEERDVWRFNHLEIEGAAVVALRSGMGLINAAAGTERLIAEHRPRLLLNYGCSGAHRPEIMPGDVVIGERVVHHSAMQIRRDGSEHYAGFGYEVAGERMDAAELASDPRLVELAAGVAADIELEAWPSELAWPMGTPRRGVTVHRGVVASADIWTQHLERLDQLHARHASLCEDMEAAAIAQVCALHGVPFLTVKDISNNEYHHPSDLDEFTDFPVAEIGKRAAAVIAALVARLA